MIQTDLLIIGSGAAGLVCAIKAASKCPDKKITIITKSSLEECNTKYAQGGIAVVINKLQDSFQSHIEDTLRAGDGKCNRQVVEMVINAAPTQIAELAEWGVSFDLTPQGNYDLGREGGHSQNRVIHHKDNTGEAIELVLLSKAKSLANIHLLDFHLASDLLIANDATCIGANVLDIKGEKILEILSQATILATGGCGAVYEHTTNPLTSTGGGIALAIRAHAKVSNMQYMQFHPTAVFANEKGKLALVSEALRGEGAKLLNSDKEAFMHKYDDRAELASRDIVSRAIYQEMKAKSSDFIYLDCRHVVKETLLSHFPNIYQECKERGYDLRTDLLPIVPASHYLCGGVDVDMDGKTSVDNLYAIGECSNTGLHGANRLASNSLLEALVYGSRAAKNVTSLLEKSVASNSLRPIFMEYRVIQENTRVEKIQNELKNLMTQYVGIVRSNADLLIAQKKCIELQKEFSSFWNKKTINVQLQELRDMLAVTQIMIQHSIEQHNNAGTFYNIDLDENN